jgi:hypothetical protein
MNDTPPDRDRLRREFLRPAAIAFDLMFPDTPEDQQAPFDPREQRGAGARRWRRSGRRTSARTGGRSATGPSRSHAAGRWEPAGSGDPDR